MASTIFPTKLHTGDTIAVIAPSDSIQNIEPENIQKAENYFAQQGFGIIYGKGLKTGSLPLQIADKQARLGDLEWAIREPKIRGLLLLTGGENVNQLLPDIDFSMFKYVGKPIVGYSDNTALLNALFVGSGLVTYYGPHFGNFASTHGARYTGEFFKKCVMSEEIFELRPSKQWYSKKYATKKKPATTIQHANDGWWVIQKGISEGTIIGGEISTILLLHGGKWAPRYKNKIVFLEMYYRNLAEFDRMVEAIVQQPGGDSLEGLLIGRFQPEAHIKRDDLTAILKAKPQLRGVPIIANLDFGHTMPRLTLPIGGVGLIRATDNETMIRIGDH